jgi:hypothetical protein|tara:strand:- start:1092 stop:1823 length:732 start_codon:yes stop_codon:yes gene_type:complete
MVKHKNYIVTSFVMLFSLWYSGIAYSNDIYITQSGDGLDLDVVQDGTNNVIGNSTTDVTLAGDDMTFSITQTGDANIIAAIIKGSTYTGTWTFTGDNNEVDLLCSSSATGDCDTVTLNIATTGDDNDYTLRVGSSADSESSVINFTVTGDDNIINSTVNGKSAALTVTLDNSASLSTNSSNSDAGVAITTVQTGDGDAHGHGITLDVTGGGGTIDISQTGVKDNIVDLTIDGDDFDVDITQSD